MIISNFNTTNFPDKTSLIKYTASVNGDGAVRDSGYIVWTYEGDHEMAELWFIANHYQSLGIQPTLILPYTPNARMDRVHDPIREVFTLKYFCKFINSLNFKKVYVFDPHSDVSTALINNVEKISIVGAIRYAMAECGANLIYFPDAGAMKRYDEIIKKACGNYRSGPCKLNVAYGNKVRDWDTGEIKGLEVVGEIPDGAKVLMIDDICSYGGTMYFSAKKLKELGAGSIEMYVSHCENSIADLEKGKIFKEDGLIDRVYTTDSVLTIEHPKIKLVREFKKILSEAKENGASVPETIEHRFG